MDETQGGNEGGSRGQWMKDKRGGGNGWMKQMDEKEGGMKGQWMKRKGE